MDNQFVFVGCKFGYQQSCKSEVLANCPNLRFAFSRPGFLTFKIADGSADLSTINALTFVRIAGISLGRIQNESLDEANARLIRELIDEHAIEHSHVWSRHFGNSDDQLLQDAIGGQLPADCRYAESLASSLDLKVNQMARSNQIVLDLIQVGESETWYGWHRVDSPHQSWPGGVIHFELPTKPVSRAYFKTKEALIWSRFPINPGDTCIELGCAPGGSAQALLEAGVQILGIDPADMDESILAHPNFTHLKMRGADVKKKRLANAKWLFSDSNVAPQYTLDTLEEITTNQNVNLKGIVLTLKLLDAKLANDLESYRERVRRMGFQYVRTRQLAFNRNEVCLVALKRKSILRFGKQKKATNTQPENTQPENTQPEN